MYVCMYMHIYIYSILINDHKDMNTYICLYIYIYYTYTHYTHHSKNSTK